MTKEEIIEGNKLIAGFMDVKTKVNSRGFLCTIPDADLNFEYIQYHSSWDWIMPVVEKISNWYDNDSDDYMDSMEEANLLLFRLSIFAGIKETYQSVIKFIQWYNKQKHNGTSI